MPRASRTKNRPSEWVRKYLSFLSVGVLAFLLVAVLPSALKNPLTNPSQTPEYAPVNGEGAATPGGNVSSFGLGSGGFGLGRPAPLIPAEGTGAALGKNLSSKKCVGKPPRQTEDPLSPPCVAFFDGNNFGATYQGVNGTEIRVLVYTQSGGWVYGTKTDTAIQDTYFDLAQPPQTEPEHVALREVRRYQRYFNDRFQAYGRFVHFYVYFGSTSTQPSVRRSEAAANLAKIKPFAVIGASRLVDDTPYLESMAQDGVLNFGSIAKRSEAFFQRFPRLVWGVDPSIEQFARMFSTFVCQKVVPYQTSFSGNALGNGVPRKLGLVYTTDPNYPGKRLFKDLVKSDVEACGGKFELEGPFPKADNGLYPENTEAGRQNMANFKLGGVTTLVWAGGYESEGTKAAAAIDYRPEWIVAGDQIHPANIGGQNQHQLTWQQAWIVTNATQVISREQEPCHQAIREADPQYMQGDADLAFEMDLFACQIFYPPMRQLFTGIQVAGPRLNPESIDKGFHAIPPIPSSDVRNPACFYLPGDYTCVKDAVAEWWDASGLTPNDPRSSRPGCWRINPSGRRYIAGSWPTGDVLNLRTPGDVCNYYNLERRA